MNKRILIWGTGRNFKLIMIYAQWYEDIEIIGLIESKKQNNKVVWGNKTFPVFEPRELQSGGVKYDKIIISTVCTDKIVDVIKEYGFAMDKVIVPCRLGNNQTKWDIVKQMLELMPNAESVVSTLLTVKRFCGAPILPMRYDMVDDTVFNKDILDGFGFIEGDYARVRTLELLIKEIREKNINGALAEVGVWTGGFSKIMKYYFPERKMYLYDTFQGFDEGDLNKEVKNGNTAIKSLHNTFQDTSLERVKKNMGHEETCYYRVGHFPETIENETDEQFCLVSLDADLYAPTLAGLKFFYPRLVKGGYILLHEYNCSALNTCAINIKNKQNNDNDLNYFEGIKKAVTEYEKCYGSMCKVPISDRNGTLIITK